jgi:hypothetical protein
MMFSIIRLFLWYNLISAEIYVVPALSMSFMALNIINFAKVVMKENEEVS